MNAQHLEQAGESGFRIGRRNILAGMAGLGVVASLGATRAFAQGNASNGTNQTDRTAVREAHMAAAYQNFLGKLAANLGESDTSVVDTAIRDALKAMVEEQFEAGEISRNLADEIKGQIDSGVAPFGFGVMGGLGIHDMDRRRDRIHDRWTDDDTDDEADDDSSTEATPSA